MSSVNSEFLDVKRLRKTLVEDELDDVIDRRSDVDVNNRCGGTIKI